MKPERFGKYTILRRLGRGGMAEVFLASTAALDGQKRVLALKRLLPPFSVDPQIISMMTDEARVCAWLNHPQIVQVLDFGKVEQTYYISLEFVGGCDLCDLIRVPNGGIGRPLPPGTALYIVSQVAEALEFAHQRRGPGGDPLGIIHRDVSPHNVLLSTDGEVKLTDFGLVRASISLHYSTADVIRGKFSYMPREQARGGDIDQRIDLFAAGVTLYEALTGVKPYTSNTLAEQIYQLEQPIPPPSALVPELPPEVDIITQRAMSPTVDGRYVSAGQLATDLQRALARFSNPGREAEQLSALVKGFIGEDAAYFAGLERMTLDSFPLLEGGIISDELAAVRRATSTSTVLPRKGPEDPMASRSTSTELSDFTDEVMYDEEDDTLAEEDELLPRTMLADPADRRDPVEPQPTDELLPRTMLADPPEHREPNAGVPVPGAGSFLPPEEIEVEMVEAFEEDSELLEPTDELSGPSGLGVPDAPLMLDDVELSLGDPGPDDMELGDTVLADENDERRRWADKALGLPPMGDDEQATIQRSPEQMIGAFERALKHREKEKALEARKERRRKLLMGCLIGGGLCLFVVGFSIGWMFQGKDEDKDTDQPRVALVTGAPDASAARSVPAPSNRSDAQPPTPDAAPGGPAGEEPEGAKEPAGAKDPAGAKEPAGAKDPAKAKDSAGAKDPAKAKDPAGAKDPAKAKDPAGAKDPTGAKDPAKAKEPAKAKGTRPRSGARPRSKARPKGAKRKGYLSVNTDSPARVYIGDDPKSTPAPIKKMPLSSGIHRVRVFFEKKKAFSDTQWVSINPGQTFTLYFSSPTE